LLAVSALLLAVCLVQLVAGQESRLQESHLREAGSGPLLARSAFAHGYRHGYEEGYHIGNVDINMGRVARAADKKQFHGVKISTGYSSSFGPQASFDAGFQAGLKAGYHDGYEGRVFRAVRAARSLSADLDGEPPASDHSNAYFDQGVASGYEKGFRQGEASAAAQAQIDFREVKCPESGPNSPAQAAYCGGYRRGFVLGHTDALALRPDFASLEASK
jgi:flagellar biosynthesis/type III secretory pathway protein FliH